MLVRIIGLTCAIGIAASTFGMVSHFANERIKPILAAHAHRASLYPSVPLAEIAAGKWKRPRASVTGTVELVKKEDDGDWHIKLVDGKDFIVCEIVPELPMTPPKKGQRVTIKGIVRFDGYHPQGTWWELHPVVSWK